MTYILFIYYARNKDFRLWEHPVLIAMMDFWWNGLAICICSLEKGHVITLFSLLREITENAEMPSYLQVFSVAFFKYRKLVIARECNLGSILKPLWGIYLKKSHYLKNNVYEFWLNDLIFLFIYLMCVNGTMVGLWRSKYIFLESVLSIDSETPTQAVRHDHRAIAGHRLWLRTMYSS